ncbi:hypothetical protein ACX64O_24645 [Pseudomonas fitomaticsae]
MVETSPMDFRLELRADGSNLERPCSGLSNEVAESLFAEQLRKYLLHNLVFTSNWLNASRKSLFQQALKSRLVAGFSGTGLVYFW